MRSNFYYIYLSKYEKSNRINIYRKFRFFESILNLDIPKFKDEIKCSSSSITYEIGGFQYSTDDLTKIKTKNHCLYYYYNSLGLYAYRLGNKDTVSKEKCISALTMDRTKNADIYCAFVMWQYYILMIQKKNLNLVIFYLLNL